MAMDSLKEVICKVCNKKIIIKKDYEITYTQDEIFTIRLLKNKIMEDKNGTRAIKRN